MAISPTRYTVSMPDLMFDALERLTAEAEY